MRVSHKGKFEAKLLDIFKVVHNIHTKGSFVYNTCVFLETCLEQVWETAVYSLVFVRTNIFTMHNTSFKGRAIST